MHDLGFYYEELAVEYLRDRFKQIRLNHRGSTLPFVSDHDIYIVIDDQVFSIEVKGTQIIDESDPRFNRVKITKKDVDNPPDLFLIVIDINQLGDSKCDSVFKLVWATELIDVINKPYTRNKSVSFLQLFKIKQADPINDDF